MYDSRVGRFFATDPLEKKYPQLTPYQFSSNNPLGMKEIEGLEGIKYSEYDINGKLIRHVVKLKILVVTVDKLDKQIKVELIDKLGKKEGKKEWNKIVNERVVSDYNSNAVDYVKSTLNSKYNPSEGLTNTKGELVNFSFDVQELHIDSRNLGNMDELIDKARNEFGLMSTEIGKVAPIDYYSPSTFANKISPANLLTKTSAGGAQGDNVSPLTRISQDENGLTVEHETAHQFMTLLGADAEHDLMGKYECNLTPVVIDQILKDAYQGIDINKKKTP